MIKSNYKSMKKFLCAFFMIASVAAIAQTLPPNAVACVGRIVPGARISKLAAPSLGGSQPIVEKLYIRRGSEVKAGDIVALLFGADRAKASLERAKAAEVVVRANADINIMQQKNLIADLEGSFEQNRKILDEKDPPRREREEINYEQESLTRKISQAKAMLPLIERAQAAAVADAKAVVAEAEAAFQEYELRTPIAGEVVETNVVAGEAVGMEGVCEIADTDTMYVEAEVYVSDISKVKEGDTAEIFSDALSSKKYTGKVIEILNYVKANRVFSPDPSAYSNLKVVIAKIKLDSATDFKGLIGSQVNVRILVK